MSSKILFIVSIIGMNFYREEAMSYKKPKVLAQGIEQMAECRPNSKPSGRPCNPPRPTGR